jgi:hypothetical protein
MAPAFTQRWHGWVFLIFIAFFLALPFIPKPKWVDRSVLYLGFGTDRRYSHFANHILQEDGDIDILFLGPSLLDASVNPLIVKDALRPMLDREPVVYVAGHGRYGVDYEYIAFHDVIRKRKVKMLVLYSKYSVPQRHLVRHPFANLLWDFSLHAPALTVLKDNTLLSDYFFSVMTGLRLVLGPFHDRLELVSNTLCIDTEEHLGACPRGWEIEGRAEKMPPPREIATEQLIHYRSDPPMFSSLIPSGRYNPYERVFLTRIFELARENGTRIVFLSIPNDIMNIPANGVPVPILSKNHPGISTPIIGVTLKDLFPDLNRAYIAREFYTEAESLDSRHPHYGTANYFTQTILPAVTALYKRNVLDRPDPSAP